MLLPSDPLSHVVAQGSDWREFLSKIFPFSFSARVMHFFLPLELTLISFLEHILCMPRRIQHERNPTKNNAVFFCGIFSPKRI